jgi:polyhydroxyalkanoate synthesis regulator phasin
MSKSRPISLRFRGETLDYIDKIARAEQMSRSQIVERIIAQSREDADTDRLQEQIDELREQLASLTKKSKR